MVASKLTINARRPESVRVRVHLRWLGALSGRVQVNAQKRFNHKSVPTDGFHAPAGRRGPARRPGSPPGALAQRKTPRPRRVAGVVFRRFRRHDALESSSNRPGRIRPRPHRARPPRNPQAPFTERRLSHRRWAGSAASITLFMKNACHRAHEGGTPSSPSRSPWLAPGPRWLAPRRRSLGSGPAVKSLGSR